MRTKLFLTLLILCFVGGGLLAQHNDSTVQILGVVVDKLTREPLAYATIGVAGRVNQAYSQSTGGFALRISKPLRNDTIVVTYVGFKPYKHAIEESSSSIMIELEPSVTVLPDVSITNHKIDLRYIDRNIRLIRDQLYGMYCEVTNVEYNYFLDDLKDNGREQLLKLADFDLRGYSKASGSFYEHYHHSPVQGKRRHDSLAGYGDYPAVNISHAAAVAYCEWLTQKYNENATRKKFKKVKFRLPTRNEWQIAALGYPKFQSWEYLQNIVQTNIPDDSSAISMCNGTKKMIPTTDRVLYPWFKCYYYRDKAINFKGCYLGNFRIESAVPCPAKNPGFDGYIIMGRTGSYFPNDMGLFDVVGNVAEMIDEQGVAMGGSWKDAPEESTMLSTKKYSGPDESVGFRVFMEVLEK